MNLFQIFTLFPGHFTLFPDHDACIEDLEKIRFRDGDYCPHCGSSNLGNPMDDVLGAGTAMGASPASMFRRV